MGDLLLCGWRVRSQIPLPELHAWTADDRAPDVEISLGTVPKHLDGAKSAGPVIEVAPDNTCRLEIKRVARYLVSGGRRVVIEPAGTGDDAAVRAFLLGTVFAMLCHQRGLYPLHASSVRIGNVCIAMAGPSGIGKSTMAAALVQCGAVLAADDVTVIDLSAPGSPMVFPAYPQMKLWRDSLDGLNISAEGLQRVRRTFEKFTVPAAISFETSAVPLAAIYVLLDAAGMQQAAIRRLDGLDAVSDLTRNFYQTRLVAAMGRQGDAMQAAFKILEAVPLYRLPLAHTFDGLRAAAQELLTRHREVTRP